MNERCRHQLARGRHRRAAPLEGASLPHTAVIARLLCLVGLFGLPVCYRLREQAVHAMFRNVKRIRVVRRQRVLTLDQEAGQAL
jgi:hypothetical protein